MWLASPKGEAEILQATDLQELAALLNRRGYPAGDITVWWVPGGLPMSAEDIEFLRRVGNGDSE